MKKVFIKYNPYSLETEVTVDEKKLAENSEIRRKSSSGSRLQEWIEDLPKDLIEEYNDNDFDIVFYGTLMDYEDLEEVFLLAQEQGKLTARLDRRPVKEISDKESKIDEVFKKITEGPFNELRDAEIINAFQHAKSSEFEVCVIATMSAGKSTLINSMLGTKIMPTSQGACTAVITRIKDVDKIDAWRAKVFDKNGHLLETYEELTYETMQKLNNGKNFIIKAEGDIPFVSAEDISLVLIDTPGPNNARDEEHGKVQEEFLRKSSKSLVLYIMDNTFCTNDSNTLLERVADSMKVNGKQSRDRFIFVLNKIDQYETEDGDDNISDNLNKVKEYLKEHGITNANLFPTAALPALRIRQKKSGVSVKNESARKTENDIANLNENGALHLEKYAPLPTSIRKEIEKELEKAIENNDADTQALIHTGIISVEAAIRQYVEKYAKTAKIKNIVDTFIHKLEDLHCLEKTKQELGKNRAEGERIARQISAIRQKIDDGKTVKKFEDSVSVAVNQVRNDADETIKRIVGKYQEQLTKQIDAVRGQSLSIEEVDEEVASLIKFAKVIEPEFRAELDELVRINLIKTGNTLLEQYKEKLAALADEIDISSVSCISIEPLKMVSSNIISGSNISVSDLIHQKEVEDGKEWIINIDKKWYKPWTWFQEDGYYRKKYKNVQYVKADELAAEFFSPIKDNLFNNGEAAQRYAIEESNNVAAVFNKEFKRVDAFLKDKLLQLESFAVDHEKAEERIRETEKNLKWLEEIEKQVISILEI